MTNSNNGRTQWTDERLDRLASAVETNKDAIAELRLTAEALLQTVIQHQENFDVLVQEIRGLRTENRRILNHLFPEQQQGE